MKIYLNGEKIETTSTNVEQLIIEKGFDPSGLIVEKNLEIVKKEDWLKTKLKHDDKIEFVTFVGGG